MQKLWSSPRPLDCEGLSRNLASTLERFRSDLETTSAQDCVCQPVLDGDPWRVHTYVTLAPRLLQFSLMKGMSCILKL